jgi:hypothetical protein
MAPFSDVRDAVDATRTAAFNKDWIRGLLAKTHLNQGPLLWHCIWMCQMSTGESPQWLFFEGEQTQEVNSSTRSFHLRDRLKLVDRRKIYWHLVNTVALARGHIECDVDLRVCWNFFRRCKPAFICQVLSAVARKTDLRTLSLDWGVHKNWFIEVERAEFQGCAHPQNAANNHTFIQSPHNIEIRIIMKNDSTIFSEDNYFCLSFASFARRSWPLKVCRNREFVASPFCT